MKELDQSRFKMRIIRDLGMLTVTTKRPSRTAIFECVECLTPVTVLVANANNKEHCKECKVKAHSKGLMKPIIQADFKMKIIEDLGMQRTSTGRNVRACVFECGTCFKHFTVRPFSGTARTQVGCRECSDKNDRMHSHPLYSIWNTIKQRCVNPKRKDYHNYGGKGVYLASYWLDDPVAFITWCVANGWNKDLVIDKDIKSRLLELTPYAYTKETLSFITATENTREACGKAVLQYSLDGTLIAEYPTVIEATLALGKPKNSKASIASASRGHQHTAFGYKWKYK